MNRLIILLFAAAAASAQSPAFEKTLSAAGQSEAIFPVSRWGRYAVEMESDEGVALQLVDRKTGFRERDGVIGERNGRIDVFLDFGEYKIIAQAAQKGQDAPKLHVYPFEELNRDKPQYLAPLREYEETLGDYQQRSYWIHLEKDTTIFLEALGRNVADVQLWQNGQWRVDCKRVALSSLPRESTPLKGYRIVQHLKAGYYLLSIYGGPIADWAEHSNRHPLYIRWELPRFAATGMGSYTISAAGYNQYLVSSSANAFVLSAPDKKQTLALSVLPYGMSGPSLTATAVDSIHAKSRDPRCMVRANRSRGGWYVVRVSGEPGRRFTLKSFKPISTRLRVDTSGSYWVSTLHTGFPQDQIGVTGGITDTAKERALYSQIDTIDSKHRIKRTFNLLSGVSLVIRVEEKGRYEFLSTGVEMTMSIRRFLIDAQRRSLERSESGKMSVALERGYYLLRLDPVKKGIGGLEVKKSTLMGMARDLAGIEQGADHGFPNLQFPSVKMTARKNYWLFINSLGPEHAGLIFRRLPLDLQEPLPVYVSPGKPAAVHMAAAERSLLHVTDAQGNHHGFTIDGKAVKSPLRIDSGAHFLSLAADTLKCLIARTLPLSRLPDADPRPFPTGEESPLRIFPELQAGSQVHLDLNRKDFAVYEFTVGTPGMYRFETTGRLKTALTLRDRFVVRTHHEAANGVGRNALIQAYMLPGRYQTRVETQGRSAGRLGLLLRENETIDGGDLTVEREKRHKVPEGVGIEYRIAVDDEASMHIVSQGQSGYYRCRLDDADGWPLVQPGSEANITRKLAAGTYQLLSLPENRKTLRIARLEPTGESLEYEGKGPHVLLLNRPAQSVWQEDSSRGLRQPARYRLSLQAPVRCRLACTEGFGATLRSGDSAVMHWEGSVDTLLSMGEYMIDLMANKPRNHTPYFLSATTGMLLPGLSYPMEPGASRREFTVSVGRKTVVELFSQGMRDLAATVRRQDSDSVIAGNDDGYNDWNFKISRVLDPGFYTLSVENRGTSGGQSEIVMASLSDTTHADWQPNAPGTIDLAGKIHTVPVVLSDDTDVINVTVGGGSRVGAIIERATEDGSFVGMAQREGDTLSLSAAVLPSGRYRVRLWSSDHLNERVEVSINTGSLTEVPLARLRRGLKVETVRTGPLSSAWLRVDLGEDSLTHVRIEAGKELLAVRTSTRRNRGFEVDFDRYVSSLQRIALVELQFSKAGRQKVTAEPVDLESPFAVPVTSRPRAFALSHTDKLITVFTAQMKSGIPMVGVGSRTGADFHPGGIPVWAGTFRGQRRAACVSLPGDAGRFLVWNADVQSSKIANKASVSARQLRITGKESLAFGSREWHSDAPGVMVYAFRESDPAAVTVTVPRGGMAVWRRPDGSRRVFGTDREFENFSLVEKKGDLFCIDLESSGYFTIDCIAIDDKKESMFAQPVLEPHGQPFEKNFSRPGMQRVVLDGTISELTGTALRRAGSITDINWWTGNGVYFRSVERLDSFPLSEVPGFDSTTPSGFLDCRHDAGWAIASIFPRGDRRVWWGPDTKSRRRRKVEHSQVLTMKDRVNWYSFSVRKPVHVRVMSDARAAAVVLRDGQPQQSFAGLEGLQAEMPLAKGSYELGIRGLHDVSLKDVSVTLTFQPIVSLTENDPPGIRLASGESVFLRFIMPEKRTIGIGLDTDREVWQSRLYTDDFALIGKGQQQFVSLEKGTYYLGLSIPWDQESAECVVRLVGQEPPPDEPPEEVIRTFIQKAE